MRKARPSQTTKLLIIFIFILFCTFFMIVITVSAWYMNLGRHPASTPTADTRPKISGCLSWKDLTFTDYAKTLCVYGYPSLPKTSVSLGRYVEFYTDPNWLTSVEYGWYDWKDEGRPYIVQIGHLDEISRETFDDTWWYTRPGETSQRSKCIAVTGEIRMFTYRGTGEEYKGFFIKVANTDSMYILSNC